VQKAHKHFVRSIQLRHESRAAASKIQKPLHCYFFWDTYLLYIHHLCLLDEEVELTQLGAVGYGDYHCE
jgi:hypothetical protein